MKILVDGLGLGALGGARKSFLGWIRAISRAAPASQFNVYLSRPEPSLEDCTNLQLRLVPIKNRFLLRLWAQANFPRLVIKERPDLFHAMKNLATLGVTCPAIVTINDLNYMVLPELFSKIDRLYWRSIQGMAVRRATHVIAISENTRRDVLCYFGLAPTRVTTIYPAADSAFSPERDSLAEMDIRRRYDLRLDRPFILYVGGWAVHKNVSTLLSAFGQLSVTLMHDLVIVGGRFHTTNERLPIEIFERSDLQQRIHLLGVVPDTDMPHLYRMANIFAMPSLNEGFGIALLEAMTCGTPVVASRCGSLPEVGGNAAVWVDSPRQVAAWVTALGELGTIAEERARRRVLCLEQAERFNWERTGTETLRLYERILANS